MKTKNMKKLFWNTTSHSILLGLIWGFVMTIISFWFLASSVFARDSNIVSADDSPWWVVLKDSWPVGKLLASVTKSEKDFPYRYKEWKSTTDMGNILSQTNQGWSLLENYLDLFNINYSSENWKAIAYVQVVINYVLSLLWIIAVVLIMYSFYSIFLSSKSEEAISNAKKTVMWASIGLILVGVSAYIVNFIFYIYNKGL